MGMRVVTEETIGGLFNEGRMTPEEFGLRMVEVRSYGQCHPSEYSPCEHGDETCTLVVSRYGTDGEQQLSVPCCEQTCPNVWDTSGVAEGIGGEYAAGGTFSYLEDAGEVCGQIYQRAEQLAD